MRRIIRFSLVALLAIIALSAIWAIAGARYQWLLVKLSGWAMPHGMSLTTDRSDIYILSDTGQTLGGVHGTALYFGLVLLLALVLATPALRLGRRLIMIAAGLGVMLATHVAILSVLALLARNPSVNSAPSPTGFSLVLLATFGFNLIPALVWAALCLRKWIATTAASA